MSVEQTPLVLLHGVTMSAHAWDTVAPLLAPHHTVITLTALGHRGGPPPRRRPVRMVDVIDDIERQLDELGVARAHFAGNSMGGWISVELARRGRAESVCALSPAGFWSREGSGRSAATSTIAQDARTARFTRPLAPIGLRIPRVRRIALANIARHGDRADAQQALTIVHDLLGCTVTADLLSTDEYIAALDPLPCPITLAWSEHDRIFPAERHGPIARRLLPHASYLVLPGVGHVPMIDDPELVAQTILASAQSRAAEAG